MAKAAAEVLVRFEGDDSQLKSVIKGVNSDLDKTGSGKFEGLKSGLISVGKAAASAGALAVTGLTAMVKQSVDAFKEYEQNVGGTEAVFGQSAAKVQKNATTAYKNMGLSASDYMATANKMGSLFQGSGIEQTKALELTEDAMQRAADVASVMGVDMSMAMESVAGAAKGNFTMMDNLGVAMNATTLEAYALEKGINFNWNTATQAQKSELAMQMFMERTAQYAGNFAKESEQTISGSFGMMKASFSDFLSAMAGGGDMEATTQALVDSIANVAKNLLPVIQQVANSIITTLPSLVEKLVPVLTDVLTQLVETLTTTLPTLMPVLVEGFLGLLKAIITAIPQILPPLIQGVVDLVNGLIEMLPELLPSLLQAFVQLMTAIPNALTQIIPKLTEALPGIITAITTQLPILLPQLIEAATQLFMAFVQALPAVIEALVAAIPDIIVAIIGILPQLISSLLDVAIELFMALVDAIPVIIDELVKAIPSIIVAIVKLIPVLIPKLLAAAVKLFMAIVQAIPKILGSLLSAIGSLIGSVVSGLAGFVSKVFNAAKDLFWNIVDAIKGMPQSIKKAASDLINGAINKVKEFGGKFLTSGENLINDLIDGVKNVAGNVVDAVVKPVKDAWNAVCNFLGIKSPSRLFADVGKNMMKGAENGVVDAGKSLAESTAQQMADAVSAAKQQADAIAQAIANSQRSAGQAGRGVADMLSRSYKTNQTGDGMIYGNNRAYQVRVTYGNQGEAASRVAPIIENMNVSPGVDYMALAQQIGNAVRFATG